jgi:GNAT superfamily N-acetyltransferase
MPGDAIIREALPRDSKHILALYAEYAVHTMPQPDLERLIQDYPAFVVCREEKILGFVYSSRFAPDILELFNIYITASLRSTGISRSLLARFESAAAAKYSGIILCNSQRYETRVRKRSAHNFYLENGYELVFHTRDTNVFMKLLNSSTSACS